MRIGIDVRCLLEPFPSGVAYYTKNLLSKLFEIDSANEYFLFYNSYKKENLNLIEKFKKYPNVHLKGFHYPNKFLNGSINFLHYPNIDKLIGGVDVFFAPNLQFISLSDKCKKVVTVHDISFDLYPEFLSLRRKLWHKFINPKRFIKQADKVIAVSKNTKKDVVKNYNISKEKIKVIYSGVDIDKNSVETGRGKYILTISTLEPRKNIESLIQAFIKLRQQEKFKDYQLLIAGPKGWKADNIYKLAEVDKNIKFLGFVSDQEKAELYKKAEVFVYPSFYEGFGFPPLEALAYQTPVIVSMNSSLPEILNDSAIYINPYDVNELTKALTEVLGNSSLRENLVSLGQEQIKKFDWQKTAEQTLDIFKNC